MGNENTKLVRIDKGVVEAVEKLCAPTKASVGLYFGNAAKAKMVKDKVRNSEKVSGKR